MKSPSAMVNTSAVHAMIGSSFPLYNFRISLAAVKPGEGLVVRS